MQDLLVNPSTHKINFRFIAGLTFGSFIMAVFYCLEMYGNFSKLMPTEMNDIYQYIRQNLVHSALDVVGFSLWAWAIILMKEGKPITRILVPGLIFGAGKIIAFFLAGYSGDLLRILVTIMLSAIAIVMITQWLSKHFR